MSHQSNGSRAAAVHLAEEGRYVRVVTLDNPPVNALDDATYAALLDAFERVAVDADARAVVLTSAGRRAFCAGTDIRDFGHQHLDEPMRPMRHAKLVRSVFESIYDCPVPVIGCLNGPAVGAGVALAAACDVLFAAEGSVVALPEIDVGVLGGARALSRLVPQQRVRQMMYTGVRVDVAELVRRSHLPRPAPPTAPARAGSAPNAAGAASPTRSGTSRSATCAAG
jgi:enoyl-CoA hydratase